MTYIPDPLELLEQRMEETFSRIQVVDGEERYPCDNCGTLILLDELECIDPTGMSGGLCGNCFAEWVEYMKEKRRNEKHG